MGNAYREYLLLVKLSVGRKSTEIVCLHWVNFGLQGNCRRESNGVISVSLHALGSKWVHDQPLFSLRITVPENTLYYHINQCGGESLEEFIFQRFSVTVLSELIILMGCVWKGSKF